MARRSSIGREVASAIAVLGLYLLTLLLPLHQAAGLQRDLAALGYASAATWSICGEDQAGGGTDPTIALKCPAVGIGKQDFAGPLPVATTPAPPSAALPVRFDGVFAPAAASIPDHVGQPRAPPARA